MAYGGSLHFLQIFLFCSCSVHQALLTPFMECAQLWYVEAKRCRHTALKGKIKQPIKCHYLNQSVARFASGSSLCVPVSVRQVYHAWGLVDWLHIPFLRKVVVVFKRVFHSRNRSLSAFPSQPHNRDFPEFTEGCGRREGEGLTWSVYRSRTRTIQNWLSQRAPKMAGRRHGSSGQGACGQAC